MEVVATPVDTLVKIPRKIWTREEAHMLVDLGFPNAEKLELIEGELINRKGKKHPHILWQHLIHAWLAGIFGWEYVRLESATDVAADDNPHSEPEPDIMVTTRPIRDYTAIPTPSDLRLVVEIASSTLDFDLKIKAPLYARAGIVEYWVVDIPGKRLIVHREPANGAYKSVVAYASSETMSPLAAPDALFCLDRL